MKVAQFCKRHAYRELRRLALTHGQRPFGNEDTDISCFGGD